LSYLASASVFVVAATLLAHPQEARDARAAARAVAEMVQEDVWQPMMEAIRLQDVAFLDTLDQPKSVNLTMTPPGPNDVRTLARSGPAHVAPRTLDDDRITDPQFSASVSLMILPDLTPDAPAMPAPPEPKLAIPRSPRVAAPDIEIARAPTFQIPEPPPLDAPAPTNRATAVAARLKTSLTPEMLRNFDLFLYVSKADRGPLAQRMYVFRKTAGHLNLAYDWAASTGREQEERTPSGRRSFTATPHGYYELDPARMYRRYHSVSWDQDMPNAMFFNWERAGLQTGLAIHSATGDDIAKLGSRASAGCVHLSPENAATLYQLIRGNYRGAVPRFAYNRETETMSNSGAFMRDAGGNLKMADGYRVLIFIEDYGGSNVVAALY
jgi:hypothetical protein